MVGYSGLGATRSAEFAVTQPYSQQRREITLKFGEILLQQVGVRKQSRGVIGIFRVPAEQLEISVIRRNVLTEGFMNLNHSKNLLVLFPVRVEMENLEVSTSLSIIIL